MKDLRTLPLLAFTVLCSTALAAAPKPLVPHRYEISALPVTSGADFFQPRRINNRGDVLGHLDFSTGEFKDVAHAALFSHGVTIDLHLFVSPSETDRSSLPIDLNDRGEAIFNSDDGSFIYENAALREGPEPAGTFQFEARGLNNAGWIVGAAHFENGDVQAVLYRRGHFHLLGSLPGLQSQAFAINQSGQIVGSSGDHAVVFTRNGVVDLGGVSTYAIRINNRGDILRNASVSFRDGSEIVLSFSPEGMNDHGQIVGSTSPYSLSSDAMLQVANASYVLNDLIDSALGWKLIYAYDINDRGQIVGWGSVGGHWSGFLLTPRGTNDR